MKPDLSFLNRLVDAVNGVGSIEDVISEWRERFKPTDDWRFTAKPGKGSGFTAWCAKSEYLGNSPLDLPFDMEVYFEFGNTAEEAISKLKRKILN